MELILFATLKNIQPAQHTALLCELSTYCRTFTTDAQDYMSDGDYILTSFADTPSEISLDVIWNMLSLILPATTTITDVPTLETRIGAMTPVVGLTFHKMLDDGTFKLPAKLTFTIPGSVQSQVTIYFSDSELRSDYRNTKYKVIPPTGNSFIDNLSTTSLDVESIPESPSISDINHTVGDMPYTSIQSVELPLHAINDTSIIKNVKFYVAIYGQYHGNITTLKTAILTHIQENTNLQMSLWARILPSLFISDSYIVIPNWTPRSIPSKPTSDYSSIINVNEVIDTVYATDIFASKERILNKLEVVASTYRGLILNIMPENEEVSFRSLFPDYTYDILSGDNHITSDTTIRLARLLGNMMVVAEGTASTSSVPENVSFVTIGNDEYVVGSLDTIVFKMLTRGQ